MNQAEEAVASALRQCTGGVGEPISEERMKIIREGLKNSPENETAFDEARFLEGADIFLKNHPCEAVPC